MFEGSAKEWKESSHAIRTGVLHGCHHGHTGSQEPVGCDIGWVY